MMIRALPSIPPSTPPHSLSLPQFATMDIFSPPSFLLFLYCLSGFVLFVIVVKPYAYIHSYSFLNVMSWWMIFSARRYATTINYENFARVVYGRFSFSPLLFVILT